MSKLELGVFPLYAKYWRAWLLKLVLRIVQKVQKLPLPSYFYRMIFLPPHSSWDQSNSKYFVINSVLSINFVRDIPFARSLFSMWVLSHMLIYAVRICKLVNGTMGICQHVGQIWCRWGGWITLLVNLLRCFISLIPSTFVYIVVVKNKKIISVVFLQHWQRSSNDGSRKL